MSAGQACLRPEAVTRRLREIGPRWQRDIRTAGDDTKALYLPLLAAPPDTVTVTRDLPYGAHPRQVLDLYRPAGARGAPVVAFVHGGAFVRGSKDINARMYGNVLTWFARHGCLGVNIEYRLAPEAPYPGGAVDVGLACHWLARHVADHGGDPARVCVIGHSAGGTHVATLAGDPVLAPEAATAASAGTAGAWDAATARHVSEAVAGLRGLVLVSARLRADGLPANPNAAGVRAYFGEDVGAYDDRSPVTHAARIRPPVFVVNAEYENPLLDLYGLEFALAIGRARGVAPWHATVPDHNHVSIMAHFDTTEQRLGEQILDFVGRVTA